MAATANIYIDQGSDYSAVITVSDSGGTPIDLTTYTVESQLRKFHGSTTSYCFNATVEDAVAGQIRLTLTATTSQSMPSGRWLYDVRIVSSTGSKKRVLEGVVTLTPQATTGPCE
jgi:hypothetical protein